MLCNKCDIVAGTICIICNKFFCFYHVTAAQLPKAICDDCYDEKYLSLLKDPYVDQRKLLGRS